MPTVILDLYFPLSAYGPLSGRGLWTRLTDGFMFSSFAPLRRTDGWETKKTRCNRLLTKRESVWKQRNLGIEGDVVSCLYEFFLALLPFPRFGWKKVNPSSSKMTNVNRGNDNSFIFQPLLAVP